MKRRKPEPLPSIVIGPCAETEGEDVAEVINQQRDDERRKQIDRLVDRFLAWQLPQSVCSDLCVIDSKYAHSRSGTNLLTAEEARQMFEHVLGAA